MKFDKQALRKAAEKATEGNYVVGHCDINKHGNLSSVYVCQEWNGEAGGVVAECHVNCLTQNSDQVYANAGFIAFASPANVISLIEEISTLEAKCAALAVENAGLNNFISSSCYVLAGEEAAWYPAIDHAPETPATNQLSIAESQFLTDVMTAAGLLSCGKRDKQLAQRLADFCVSKRDASSPAQLRKGVQS
ncbi:TPA: ead/Ea22-like family protein [Enterobacter asburiae]